MTLAHLRGAGGSAQDAQPVSDFHLVEAADGWRLTVNATDRLRELLFDSRDDGSVDASFTVHVEPNLLPGKPFAATVEPLAEDS
ncbi:MAG: hypothetical protein QOC66_3358 [Pseudonocardiales bacterium]|jgi:hypothetical protein|nr:hypothetical protein [Pseudonocardiales bacterium]